MVASSHYAVTSQMANALRRTAEQLLVHALLRRQGKTFDEEVRDEIVTRILWMWAHRHSALERIPSTIDDPRIFGTRLLDATATLAHGWLLLIDRTNPLDGGEEEWTGKLRNEVLDLAVKLENGVEACRAAGPAHAPDFTWVNVQGTVYPFKSGQQAGAIRHLFDCWKASGGQDGNGMSESALAEKLDAGSSFNMRNLFAKSPAKGVILGRPSKGVWALYLNRPLSPDSDSSSDS